MTLPHQVLGPFSARARDHAIAAWFGASGGEQAGQDLDAVLLGSDAAPLGPPHSLTHVVAAPDLMRVRSATEKSDRWTVVWSAQLDRGEVLTALGVRADGKPNGEPTDIHRTNDHIVWLDVLPMARGALSVWAEETASGDANLLVEALDATGRPRGVPMRAARGLRRWQAVSSGRTAGLVLVTSDAEPARNGALGGGSLSWQALDEEGHPEGATVHVADGASVGSDVEAVPLGGRWLLGWTDVAHEDPRVMLAAIDSGGNVRGPVEAFEGGGASVLSALTSSGPQAAVAWTEPHRRQGDTQVLGVGLVSPDSLSIAQPVAAFEIGVAPTELVATQTGFALLVSARACWGELASLPCTGPLAPTFVRLGPGLDPVQTEPLLVGDPKKPSSLGWGLTCASADRCFALAASSDTPTPLFSLDLPVRSSPFVPPRVRPPPREAPRLANVRTVTSATNLQDLAAARLGDATLVATLTTETEGRSTRHARSGAVVSTFVVEDHGTSLSEPKHLSTRAPATGGVSLCAGGDRRDGVLAAWISGTKSNGELRLAQISESGQVLRSARLGSADADASRVAIAWAGDGWLVAWVEGRGGAGQVYATKIGRQLQHVGRNERVTRDAVGPGDIAMAVRNETAWLAWSDTRESPREGLADIYATTLRSADATHVGDEIRVLATARHSRSPTLAAASATRALIAWIEDPPAGVDALGTGMLGCLDTRAGVACPPVELPLAGPGQPASIVLESAGDEVHAVTARSGIGAGITLDGLRLDAGGAPLAPPWPLVALDAPPSVDISLALAGNVVIYSDVVPGPGQRRIREAEITWRP